MRSRQYPTRLKSLELQGYKTFATKTAFEFAPTITAIVGPNGSGKSNIADAIRWVLGEQSYSLLRGKRTEDMIFAGSELRPKAGLASAEITFDNSDGWLPIDFGEVSIGRRASRDGQNDYLINGKRVRLMDVGEVLSESGLAERTYTVIGQGLVDAALSLRADERRKLFEEAAGIGLYRKRREEATRRLETTRRNLERVQDILAELRPRLRSLERQAKRAQDYEQVRQDLHASLRIWYGFHWGEAQAELAQIRATAAKVEANKQRLASDQLELEAELEGMRASLRQLRADISEASRRRSDLLERSQALGRKAAVAGERLNWLEEQRDLITSELATIDESLVRLQSRLRVVQDERETLKQGLTSEPGDSSAAAGVSDREAAELQDKFARARSLEADLQTRKVRQEAQLQQLETRLAAVEKRRDLDRNSLTEQRQKTRALQSQRNERAEQVAELETNLEKLQTAISEAEQALELRRQERDQAAQAGRELQTEAIRLQAQLAAASRRVDQDLADRARELRPQALVGPSGVWLTYPAHIGAAIHAALGEFIQGAPFRSTEDIFHVLAALEGRVPEGTAALLSLEGQVPERLEAPEGQGLLGIAADLVEARPGFANLVEAMLGRVLVVEDHAAAARTLGRIPPDARIVSLAGELYLGSGQVLLGSAAGGSDREVTPDKLREGIHESQQRAEAYQSQVERAETDIKTIKDRIDHLRSERQDLESKLEAGRTALSKQQGELATAQGNQKALKGQLQRSGEEVESLRSQLGTVSAELDEIRDQRSQAKQAIRTVRAELDRLGAGHDEQDKQARFDAIQRSIEEATARMDEYQDRIDSLESEKAGWQQRLRDNQAQEAALKSEIEGLEAQAEVIDMAIQGEDDVLAPAEEKIRNLETRRSELEGRESEIRLALQRAEYENSQIQIKLARKEEELIGLQRRIEDDFGLVAFDYHESTTGQEPLPLEGLVEKLPSLKELPEGHEGQVRRLRAQLRRMGAVNPEAQQEYEEVRERVQFLTNQVEDLRKAEDRVEEVIGELGLVMEREFRKTFDAVAVEFRETFQRLFGGGSARLHLAEGADPNEAGIEIEARLPGKREQGLAVLSGGERSLTASALVFALLRVSPPPFCVLDEVDAMLDEANVSRFCDLLSELSETTQFIVITHNRQTVQVAEAVYGITMGADSASRSISLDLEQAAREVAA